jgi:isocitrate lyase
MELGKLGYKFQFVTLAGFHVLNHSMFKLAHAYSKGGMAAYNDVQQAEFKSKADGYLASEHQGFVGVEYFDEVAQIISGGKSSTVAMEGSTEKDQFK